MGSLTAIYARRRVLLAKQNWETMSEYQYIAFRAIDAPVSEKNLDYMRRQSSRAEITPWSFDNEYHFGDFHGNAAEMLRRGYDLHLHYANFGIRTLLIRLPRGFPDRVAAKPYLDEDGLRFLRDKKGPGGILEIEPFHESGELDEMWDFDDILERLAPLRAEIERGDLRPLYLANLVIACDGNHDAEATKEAPVPAGLKKLTPAQRALAELYQLGDSMIAAAAQESPPLPAQGESKNEHAAWLKAQSEAIKDAWLAQWMSDPNSTARKEILDRFRQSSNPSVWPVVRRERTIAELQAAANGIQRQSD